MSSEILSSPESGNRIIGYDFARMLALMGMVLISFSRLATVSNSPAWLNSFIEIIMGRAVVAFVILAGIGLSLISKSATMHHDSKAITANRNDLLKRAAFLFFIGMVNCLIWPWDILHYYAVYFIISAFFITASNRQFLTLTWVAVIMFTVFMLMIQFDRGEQWDSIRPTDLWHLPGLICHILFCGLYPVFPWIGFIFIGIWLGRRDLTHHDFRNKILIGSVVSVILTHVISWVFFHIDLSKLSIQDLDFLYHWFKIDPWEPMPLFFFSGAGTAIIVICLSVILTEEFRNAAWLPLLVSVGQSTLTLYVAHIAAGSFMIWVMDFFKFEYPLFPIWGTLLFFMSSIVICHQWNRRFKKGPLGLLMRRFLVSQKKLLAFSQP